MEFSYLDIANSPILFIICLVPLFVILFQAFGFIRMGIKEAKNLNFPEGTLKKVSINAALFSIVPSLPIIIALAAMMVILGKYIPWLRLSVMGSAAYESFVADITLKAFGAGSLGEAQLTPSIFVSVVWCMTIAIMVAPVVNIFFLKKVDRKMQSFREKGGFGILVAGALFIGMLSILFTPELVNFEDPIGIVAAVVSGASVFLIDLLAKKTGKKMIGQFSFPVAMVLGMAAAVLVAAL